jgi:ABC-type transporter MlaC component
MKNIFNINIVYVVKIAVLMIFLTQNEVQSNPIAKDPTPTVKKMIGYIRYKKNSNALAMIDSEIFSSNLLKGEYEVLTSEQKMDFEEAVKQYIENKSFPIALKYFDKVDINYEKPVSRGNSIEIPSSILYNGSQQLKFSWILNEKNGNFYITDFLTDGKLISEVNREKQLLPLLKKEGFTKMLEKLRDASK